MHRIEVEHRAGDCGDKSSGGKQLIAKSDRERFHAYPWHLLANNSERLLHERNVPAVGREIRELRNEIAHEYSERDVAEVKAACQTLAPRLVEIAGRLATYAGGLPNDGATQS